MNYLKLLSIGVLLFTITNCTPPTANHSPSKSNCAPSLSLQNMNVLYIGVNNSITIEPNGISENALKVEITEGVLQRITPFEYVVRGTRPGEATITLSGGAKDQEFKCRVKRIPNPVAKLGKQMGGKMTASEFKAIQGVSAVLENFDFDAKCKIQGFFVSRIPTKQDVVETVNRGSRYTGLASKLVQKAQPGDVYYFTNIKARCPGDAAGRKINSMVFNIR